MNVSTVLFGECGDLVEVFFAKQISAVRAQPIE